jgi:ABC-type transport system involved in multi-copper enzyme maturation permease subunit
LSAVAAIPAAAVRPARPSFPGAVRSELLKIGRQSLTWWLLAGFAAVTAIALVAIVASGAPRDALRASPTQFFFAYLSGVEQLFTIGSGVFLLIVGSRLVSMEYGSGTIRLVLARGTSRLGLLAAQYTALAIAGSLLLAGFAVVAVAFLLAIVTVWHGDLSPITSLPAVAWTDMWWTVLVAAVSMAVCILLSTAAAVVGRSVAFGVGVAVAFFPADNFAVVVMLLLTRITHQDVWVNATQFFLGPILNQLPASLQTDHRVRAAFFTPFVQGIDATHCWAVIGVFSFAFLAASVVLTWRRDVLH